MNKHQQHLLALLKDIDTFCKKHKVTYYCAGGTVIGAARHKGFIPWDDDIDIYMTRKEFRRFVEAFDKDPIPNRCIEYYEKEHQHHSLVNRFHETTSTMFCHYHITGYACAGTLIDVFILDPIPDAIEERRSYLAKLWALSDIISPALSYSHRLPSEYLDLYLQYEKRIENEGAEKLAEELSADIFKYDESNCSDYCLRWGSMTLIYPIEVIGEPSYLTFEDMEIPVPHDWYNYLVAHYGCEWTQIPYVENRREHDAILREDVPYQKYYEIRDNMFSQEELMKVHFERKHAHMELSKAERPIEDWIVNLKNTLCKKEIEKRISSIGETAENLYRNCNYQTIIDVYKPFLTLQTSTPYMGIMMNHGGNYRWVFPAIVEMDDTELNIVLQSLLHSGKVRLCEKLVGIYKRGNRDYESVSRAEALINDMNNAASMYYRGDYAGCIRLAESRNGADKYPWFKYYYFLAKARTEMGKEDSADLIRLFAQIPSEEIVKAYGDMLWSNGDKQGAAKVYEELMQTCRNGFFYNDIVAKGVNVKAIPIEKKREYNGNDITKKQDQMILEIAEICKKEDIAYRLGKDLSVVIKYSGDADYNSQNREIWIDATSAVRLIGVLKGEIPENRRLISWENDSRVGDFCLIYTDTESVFCDLRDIHRWKGYGTYITIRIMRRSGTKKSYKRRIQEEEFCVNLVELDDSNIARLSSIKKILLYAMLKIGYFGGRRGRICKKLFKTSLEMESAATGDYYYYYINRPGLRPRKYSITEEEWNCIEKADWNGNEVNVFSADTEGTIINIAPREPIYILRDSNIGWDELYPIMDMKEYEKLDFRAYGKNRRITARLDKKVEGIWRQMLELD